MAASDALEKLSRAFLACSEKRSAATARGAVHAHLHAVDCELAELVESIRPLIRPLETIPPGGAAAANNKYRARGAH